MAKFNYLLLSIALFAFNACKKEAAVDNVAVTNYLKDSRLAVDMNDPKSLNPYVTDSLVKANDIIFVSESHAVASNTQMRLLFIKNLHQYTDTLCYFVELSYAAGQMLSQYLQSGDETILQFMYDNYKATFEYTKENYAFWQQLRGYTQQLQPSKKLVVVGLDIEHQSLNALRYIRDILGTAKPPVAIDSLVMGMKTKTTISYRGVNDATWVRQQNNNILVNRGDFLQFLGEKKYFELELVLLNMQKSVDYIANNTLGFRERALWENFMKLYPTIPKAKWFGQWGSYHTLQRASHTSLANFMNSSIESPVSKRVVTFYTFYENCRYMNQFTTESAPLASIESNNPYSALATTDFTLFKLDKATSPFRSQLLWWGTDEKITEGATINYFQYVLFVKNMAAMKPYK
jgi:hypothetical protein